MRPILGLVAAVVLGVPAALACEEVPANGIPEGSIAGKLPGHANARSALGSRGILVGANYIGEVLGNTSGGIKESTHYDGRLDLFMDVDLQKFAGWKGACFHVNGYQIHGTSISAENLGVLMPVSYIEATEATRLFELWIEQDLVDKKVSIRFGQLAADSEFLLSEGGGAFINGTWGWPSITADNLPSGGPAYPLATPGVRVALRPNDHVGFQVAIFNGDPVGPCNGDPQECNDHGLEFRVKDPPFVMYEASFKHSQKTMPGTIKVGGWYHFGDFEHQRIDFDGQPIGVSGGDPRPLDENYGFYAIVDQLIYKVPGTENKGVAVFGRVIGSPSDRNQVDFYAEAGITFSGMVPRRPDDVLAVGFAYTGISDDASGFDDDAGLAVTRDYEALLEICYTAQIVDGWTVQPNFQYFWHPGGHVPLDPDDPASPAVEDAAVLGLRTSLTY